MESSTAGLPAELMSAERVRRLFEITDRTLTAWIAAGKLPRPIKIGCRTYFDPRELEELLARSKRPPVEPSSSLESQ